MDKNTKTPFEQNRLGRVVLSEPFVTSCRAKDVFENFAVLLALPRADDPGLIAYYGAHPDFDVFEGDKTETPYYQPYWNDIGMYFQKVKQS